VDGKYRVTELLAMGGMGVVYAAWHSKLDCPVALKVIRPELCTDPEFLRRFSEEARSAALLRGEHVAEVLDFGCSDRGLPYLVFERLEGSDLRTILTQAGRLPTSRALQYVAQACEALKEAHALGVVHRDVKPENLFVARRADGRLCLKVLDFGIAKRACAGFTTQAGRGGLGSPYYMSPEQLTEAAQVDRRTDIWSLGVVLFELVTGECPFTGGTPTEIGARVLTAPVPTIVSRGIQAPDVDALIARCLERDPAKRFATAEELGLALRAALRSRQEFESSPQHQGAATPAGVLVRDSEAPSGGSRAFGVAALVAAAAVAMGVLVTHGIPDGPSVGASLDPQLRGIDRLRSPASWVELRAPAELERALPARTQQRSGPDTRKPSATHASAANASSWRGELAPRPPRRSSPSAEMSDGRAGGTEAAKSPSRATRSSGKPWRASREDAVDASSLERALGRWLDAIHADAPGGR
jgi:serine/threonine-protein kinase